MMNICWYYNQIQHVCQREWWIFKSLMEISWLINSIPYSTYLSEGLVDLLIPYEEKLMWLPH